MALSSRISGLPELSILIIMILFVGSRQVFVSAGKHSTAPKRLFVFGDSYADTGNTDVCNWREPYGITYPGQPSGRASDGRVFTDFFAHNLGLKTPVTYREWKSNPNDVDTNHGMNFAYGSTGVFEILAWTPTMTNQIDFFQNLIEINVYKEVRSSMALVSYAGNDYLAYVKTNKPLTDVLPFVGSVVKQLSINIRRIHSSGIDNIAVMGLLPMGCLPYFTVDNGYRFCNETINGFVLHHNSLLRNFIREYNEEQSRGSNVVYLDVHSAFTQIRSNGEFENLYQPCCKGVSKEDDCGNVEENGEKRYTVCSNTSSAFVWDIFHPTQAGWDTVSRLVLLETMNQFSPLDHFIRMLPRKI